MHKRQWITEAPPQVEGVCPDPQRHRQHHRRQFAEAPLLQRPPPPSLPASVPPALPPPKFPGERQDQNNTSWPRERAQQGAASRREPEPASCEEQGEDGAGEKETVRVRGERKQRQWVRGEHAQRRSAGTDSFLVCREQAQADIHDERREIAY